MINWTQFENDIASYLDLKQAKSEDDLAKKISDTYDQVITLGMNQYQEGILSTTKDILKTFISQGLREAKNGKDLIAVSKRFSTGVLGYWYNAKMKIDVPPPGAVSVITNVISLPGVPFTFPIRNTLDPKILAKAIATAFKLHSNTIQGITTALVPVGTSLVPTPFPWTGIK